MRALGGNFWTLRGSKGNAVQYWDCMYTKINIAKVIDLF